MTFKLFSKLRLGVESALVVLMLVQATCIVLFVVDIIDDIAEAPPGSGIGPHVTVELVANIGLVLAVIAEAVLLQRLLRQQARNERAIAAASGALADLMQGYFRTWGLTAAEADVAAFTIKGCSIAEIAGLRNAAEGTVKSQLNAIYRKSGLAGRGQLVSLLIEDLLGGPLLTPGADAVPQRSALE